MVYSFLRKTFAKGKPQTIYCRCLKNFDQNKFNEELKKRISIDLSFEAFPKTFQSTLNRFAPETFVRRCSVEKVLLEILKNLRENTCARVSFLINLFCKFCEISQNTFFYRTPPVAASVAPYKQEKYGITKILS